MFIIVLTANKLLAIAYPISICPACACTSHEEDEMGWDIFDWRITASNQNHLNTSAASEYIAALLFKLTITKPEQENNQWVN